MIFFKKLLFILISLNFNTSLASAKTYDGIQFPPSVQLDNTKLSLQGTALDAATIFEIDVFVAALYTQKKISQKEVFNPQTMAEIHAEFVQDAGSTTVQKYFLQAFDGACQNQCKTLKLELAKHMGKLPAISDGDIMKFQFYNDKVLLFHNKTLLGKFKGKDWHIIFMAMFIGNAAPSQSFSNNLLGV